MGGVGQALFWTQAMAGVWMVAATATHGPEMYDFMRAWAFGPPVKVAVAAVGPLDQTCQAPPVPHRTADNSLTVDDFAVAEDGTVDPAQYINPKTEKPFEIVQVTGQGTGNNFSPGVYYRIPEGVVFLSAMLNIKTELAAVR